VNARTAKVASVANYLRTRTGMPFVRHGVGGKIEAPYPYDFTVFTQATLDHHAAAVRDLPTKGIPMLIRYDKRIESIDDAWVTMRLAAVIPLLIAHYASINEGRE
jgi:hypothetical protein